MKDIKTIIKKYDGQLDYISGYENCNSIVKCYCNRCKNTFERKWYNIARHKAEYRCPICQTKLGQEKSKSDSKHPSVEEREKHFVESLKELHPNVKYISGFKYNGSLVLIEFNKCHHKHRITVDRLMRKNIEVCCQECIKNKQTIEKQHKEKIRRMLRQQRLSIIQIQTERKKEIRELYRKLKDNTIYINKCVRCNEEYIGKSVSKYCPKCRHRIRDKHSNKSLKKLYERDKGICKICNGLCNWNDKKVINGTTVVGNTYPSIDHIIPLAKGGSDDWENLQLVHFKCNWLKGAC